MIIDLTRLDAAPIEIDLLIKPNDLDLESDFANAKDEVQFKGSLVRRDLWITIAGDVSAKVEIACGRCLEPVEKQCDVSFETAFVKADNFNEETEVKLDIEALEVSIFEGDKIDLTEVAQEQILLSLSSQIYCREDCKGLCEKCGANRNLIDCKCDEADVDSRWSALGKLKINK